jgi:hypothetical protein
MDGEVKKMHNRPMEEPFDPYLRWLAIRDPKRPPNHYRMLGLGLFESDPEVIQNAADRQMTHVRRFQGGKHSVESQRLLNELASAKICLLDAKKKADYDAALRAEGQPASRVVTPPPLVPGRDFSAQPPPIGLSITTSGMAGMGTSAEDVSIPSMPLPLAKLQERYAAIADPEAKPNGSLPPKPKNGIFSLSIFVCMIVAAAVVLVGLLMLWSKANTGG